MYAPVLWLGGGVRYETLEVVEAAVRERAQAETDPAVQIELFNLANAAHAELTKRPKKVCDLI